MSSWAIPKPISPMLIIPTFWNCRVDMVVSPLVKNDSASRVLACAQVRILSCITSWYVFQRFNVGEISLFIDLFRMFRVGRTCARDRRRTPQERRQTLRAPRKVTPIKGPSEIEDELPSMRAWLDSPAFGLQESCWMRASIHFGKAWAS